MLGSAIQFLLFPWQTCKITFKKSLTNSNLSDKGISRRIKVSIKLLVISAPAFIRGLCGLSIELQRF